MNFKKIAVFILTFVLMFSIFFGFSLGESFALSVPTVKVTPNVISQYGNYEITFTTGKTLYKDSDKITVYFPQGTVLPCGCSGIGWHTADFSVNGVTVKSKPGGGSANNTAIITTPVTIADGSTVVVKIKSTAIIKNPPNEGNYTLSVATTKESTLVKSESYYIGYSTISTPQVFVSPSFAKTESNITVTFSTGVLGTLLKSSGKIYVEFPSQFMLPVSVSPAFVYVNEIQVSDSGDYTRITGNTISVPLPINIQSNATIKLEFSDRAKIVNPETPGKYTIKVYTSKENTPVESSEFVVTPEPNVFTNIIVLPEQNPDGKNGYYIHPINVLLIGISNTGSPVTVHYSLNDGDWNTAADQSATINLGDGIHVIKYYSEDENGTKEEMNEEQFKIDTTVPEIILTNPEGDITIPDLTYTVEGLVQNFDTNTKVIINNKEVTLNTKGKFSEQMELVEGENQIDIVAEDEAGNRSEVTFNIKVSSVIPYLIIDHPADWERVEENSVMISGSVDIVESILTVNGQSVPLNDDGTFSYELSLEGMEEGSIPIKIVATAKESGLSATKTIIVIYNPKPDETIIKLIIDNSVMIVNDVSQEIDPGRGTVPVIIPEWGRTVVPIRAIVEALNGTIDWDGMTRKVTINLEGTVINLWIDNPKAEVNGLDTWIDTDNHDVKPIIVNERTMLPLRFIAESLGATVDWEKETKTITITYTP